MTDEVPFGSILKYEEEELEEVIQEYKKSEGPSEVIGELDLSSMNRMMGYILNRTSDIYIDNRERLENVALALTKEASFSFVDKVVDMNQLKIMDHTDWGIYRSLLSFKAIELAEPVLNDKMSRLFFRDQHKIYLDEVSSFIDRLLAEDFMDNFPHEPLPLSDEVDYEERFYQAPPSTESRFDKNGYWQRMTETKEVTPGTSQSLLLFRTKVFDKNHSEYTDFLYYFESQAKAEHALIHAKKLEWLLESDVPSVLISRTEREAVELIKPRLMSAVEEHCVSRMSEDRKIYALNENILDDIEELFQREHDHSLEEERGKLFGYQQKEIDEFCYSVRAILNTPEEVSEDVLENFNSYLHTFDEEEIRTWVRSNCIHQNGEIITARNHLSALYPPIYKYLEGQSRLDEVFPKKVNPFVKKTHKELADHFKENCIDSEGRSIPYSQIEKNHQQFYRALRARSREFREHLLYRSYFEYPEE